MPPFALVTNGAAKSAAQPCERDDGASALAFRGLINGLVVEFCLGAMVWGLYLEWPRVWHPVMAFAQHAGAFVAGSL